MAKPLVVFVLFAGLAFASAQVPDGRPPDVRKLLRDPNPQARLRAALSFAAQQDEEAIGVLIALLAELPAEQSRLAEQALQALAQEWAPTPALTRDDEVSRRIRRDAWAAWRRNTDGPALLAAFRQRTLSPEQTDQVRSLIAQLGHKVYARRESAAAALVALGPAVVPLLRQTLQVAELEQARRIRLCLKRIAAGTDQKTLPPVAARLLALRQPPGATEALLAYLPFTDDAVMQWEAVKALKSLAGRSARPDPVLVKALSDKVPLRRAVAAEVLAGAGKGEARPAVRKLLTDSDPTVRLRVAVALACAADRDALPVLIGLAADLPAGQRWQAEEILHQLAGTKAPQIDPADNAAARLKYRDAWRAWWKENGATTRLAPRPVPPPLLGFTVIAALAPPPDRTNSRVLEVDQHGKVRWQFDGVNYPTDVRVLPGDRVLVSEYDGRRITERDFRGNILWQKNLPAKPYNVQRLDNGNTFVCTRAGLMEFDTSGKTVLDIKIAEPLAACKTPDGQMIYLADNGTCVRLDAAGKQLKSFVSGQDNTTGCIIDLTSRGRILVGKPPGIVEEFDLQGKSQWRLPEVVSRLGTAVRNGHVVVTNFADRRVTELDRAGRVVWQYQVSGYDPFRARKR
jgi:HEAT repeat protein